VQTIMTLKAVIWHWNRQTPFCLCWSSGL